MKQMVTLNGKEQKSLMVFNRETGKMTVKEQLMYQAFPCVMRQKFCRRF